MTEIDMKRYCPRDKRKCKLSQLNCGECKYIDECNVRNSMNRARLR